MLMRKHADLFDESLLTIWLRNSGRDSFPFDLATADWILSPLAARGLDVLHQAILEAILDALAAGTLISGRQRRRGSRHRGARTSRRLIFAPSPSTSCVTRFSECA